MSVITMLEAKVLGYSVILVECGICWGMRIISGCVGQITVYTRV